MSYLGNKNTMEVHDLDNEKNGCKINQIKEEHKQYFSSLKKAEEEGYDRCHWCLGASQR